MVQKLGLIGFVLALYWVCIGFVLGLYWVCIGFVLGLFSLCLTSRFFHNPFLQQYLRSFDFFGNWVCFAKKGWICRGLSTNVEGRRQKVEHLSSRTVEWVIG